MTENDPLLDAIDDGDVHDQLLLQMDGDETAEETLGRLLRALPVSRECAHCGRDVTRGDGLDESDWLAYRLRVADSDHRRTDVYCGHTCLEKSIDEAMEAAP